MQKITPFLWFDSQAEEAVNFYVSVFHDARIGSVSRYGEAGPQPAGSVMIVEFELFGQKFLALNGGPVFTFTEAVSFVVNCDTQEELDGYWDKLSAGGRTQQCGWLKDRFGLSWQIVPRALGELIRTADPDQAQRVMEALFKMVKIDIQGLQDAFEGR
jgi:predicted 3-demethylubiquinone-9 3-methyltransferase (glyoxalase superfamily)